MRELLPFLRDLWPERWRLAAGTGLLVLSLGAGIGLLGLSGWFITATGVAGMAAAALEVFRPSAGIRAFALTRTVARYLERLVHHDAVLRALARLRGWLFRSLARLPVLRLGRLRRSDLLDRMTADVEALDSLYLRVLGPSLAAGVTVLLTTVCLTALAGHPGALVGGTVLLGGCALVLWAWRQGLPYGQALDFHLPQLRKAAVDATEGLAELCAYGAVPRQKESLYRAASGVGEARCRAARLAGLGEALVDVLSHASLLLALVAGVPLYHEGALSGPMLALLALAALATGEAVGLLPGAWQQLGRTRSAARRILALREAGDADAPPTPTSLPRRDRPLSLALDRVTFRYAPHAEPVLDTESLAIAAGETVVLEGPSGCGKSTVLDLAAGWLQPEQGMVQLGGVSASAIPEPERFCRLGYLTQRTELFADRIDANLRVADPEAPDSELWQALYRAGLDERVRQAPGGLRSWIGEGGNRLSGGEARRLALARLVLLDTPIILLDEPFRGLDTHTAAVVADRLAPWLGQRTVLAVGHDATGAPVPDRRVPLGTKA